MRSLRNRIGRCDRGTLPKRPRPIASTRTLPDRHYCLPARWWDGPSALPVSISTLQVLRRIEAPVEDCQNLRCDFLLIIAEEGPQLWFRCARDNHFCSYSGYDRLAFEDKFRHRRDRSFGWRLARNGANYLPQQRQRAGDASHPEVTCQNRRIFTARPVATTGRMPRAPAGALLRRFFRQSQRGSLGHL